MNDKTRESYDNGTYQETNENNPIDEIEQRALSMIKALYDKLMQEYALATPYAEGFIVPQTYYIPVGITEKSVIHFVHCFNLFRWNTFYFQLTFLYIFLFFTLMFNIFFGHFNHLYNIIFSIR